jgi:hypothetical protein
MKTARNPKNVKNDILSNYVKPYIYRYIPIHCCVVCKLTPVAGFQVS